MLISAAGLFSFHLDWITSDVLIELCLSDLYWVTDGTSKLIYCQYEYMFSLFIVCLTWGKPGKTKQNCAEYVNHLINELLQLSLQHKLSRNTSCTAQSPHSWLQERHNPHLLWLYANAIPKHKLKLNFSSLKKIIMAQHASFCLTRNTSFCETNRCRAQQPQQKTGKQVKATNETH